MCATVGPVHMVEKCGTQVGVDATQGQPAVVLDGDVVAVCPTRGMQMPHGQRKQSESTLMNGDDDAEPDHTAAGPYPDELGRDVRRHAAKPGSDPVPDQEERCVCGLSDGTPKVFEL